MNLVETNSYLTWMSQSDGRIKVTDPNAQIWAAALHGASSEEVKQATLDHYRVNDTPPTPNIIRKACAAIRERERGVQSALAAGPVLRHPNTFRERNPELWDQLFAEGQRQGNAIRARHTANRNPS